MRKIISIIGIIVFVLASSLFAVSSSAHTALTKDVSKVVADQINLNERIYQLLIISNDSHLEDILMMSIN